MRQKLIIHISKNIEAIESDSEVKNFVILGRTEDLIKFNYTV